MKRILSVLLALALLCSPAWAAKPIVAGGAYYGLFVTSDTTGAAADATGTPTIVAYEAGAVADPAFTLTAAKVATGTYKVTGTVPAFTDGDSVQVVAIATVDGIACSHVVDDCTVVLAKPGSSAEYQQIARERYGVSGTVYHVKYAAGEDLTKDGLSWATAKETAGAGVKTVIEAATAGDLVLIGTGAFTATSVTVPASVQVIGAGKRQTSIALSVGSFSLGSYSVLEKLSITGGGNLGASSATNVTVRDVSSVCSTDGLGIAGSPGFTAWDSEFESPWDAANVGGSMDFRFYRCRFKSTAESANDCRAFIQSLSYGYGQCVDCVFTVRRTTTSALTLGAVSATGRLLLINPTVCTEITHASNTSNPIGISADDVDAVVRVVGGAVHSATVGSGTSYALKNNAGSLIAIGCDYDRTKTSGTITDVARIVTDTSGRAYADTRAMLGTALTEAGGAGRLAASLSTWGNVATPAATAASVNQGADNNTILSKFGFTGSSPYYVKSDVIDWNSVAVGGMPNSGAVTLASNGLDSVATTEPTGAPSTWDFRERMIWLMRRFLGKTVKNETTDTIKVYGANGITVLSSQPISRTTTQETQGEAGVE